LDNGSSSSSSAAAARSRAPRHPLLLAARQVGRQAGLESLQADRVDRGPHTRIELGRGHLAQAQSEGHVVAGRQVRKERVRLEHQAHVALVRRLVRDVLAAQHDAARGRRQQPPRRAWWSSFRSRRAEQADELALVDREAEVAHGGGLSVGQVQLLETR